MKLFIGSMILFLVGLNCAAAEVKAKTLKCDVSYQFSDANKEYKEEHHRTQVKLVRNVDAPQLSAKAKATTSDGRFEISISAWQSLKGAITRYDLVSFSIEDKVSKTLTFPSGTALPKENINHASTTLVVDMEDAENARTLMIECDLK